MSVKSAYKIGGGSGLFVTIWLLFKCEWPASFLFGEFCEVFYVPHQEFVDLIVVTFVSVFVFASISIVMFSVVQRTAKE